ncbi:hypothetical protein [Persephonella sp. IF05-L8]|uniref:hypothetical protein n=1 Tax=Persephonella sp. IF05-L8 TaxID=1158338 RepID=UPI00068D632E
MINRIYLIWIFLALLCVNPSYSFSGSKVFEKKCAQCHLLEVFDNNLNLEAPPMNIVMRQVYYVYRNEQNFILYLKDYLQNPSMEKSVCQPCIKRWGLMPPIKINSYEAEELGIWLFRRFISIDRINP